MNSPLVQIFTLLAVGVAAPCVHAGTITFDYTAPDVGLTAVSGFGSFSYSGSLTSIALGNLTSFAFGLDLSTPGSIPPTATFDYALGDLSNFSASVSNGVLISLSLATDFQAATNTSNFNGNQKDLVVTSLATNGSFIFNQDEVHNSTTVYDTGTVVVPEPSTAWLAGGGALLLAFWRRSLDAPQA